MVKVSSQIRPFPDLCLPRPLHRRHRQTLPLDVEDDYDGEFLFGAQGPDALQALDDDGRVSYVGTFSKCLFPSQRQGFRPGTHVLDPQRQRPLILLTKHDDKRS